MKINVNAMLNTLQYMGRGMLGIFIVTAVIIALMYLLNHFFSKGE